MWLIQYTWFRTYGFPLYEVLKATVWVITDFHVWCLIATDDAICMWYDMILEWKQIWNSNDVLFALTALLLVSFFFIWPAFAATLFFFRHVRRDF